jgi:hypothetical protein
MDTGAEQAINKVNQEPDISDYFGLALALGGLLNATGRTDKAENFKQALTESYKSGRPLTEIELLIGSLSTTQAQFASGNLVPVTTTAIAVEATPLIGEEKPLVAEIVNPDGLVIHKAKEFFSKAFGGDLSVFTDAEICKAFGNIVNLPLARLDKLHKTLADHFKVHYSRTKQSLQGIPTKKIAESEGVSTLVVSHSKQALAATLPQICTFKELLSIDDQHDADPEIQKKNY